ncbi:MAG: hypothetical protein JWR09_1295, partial [Mucilaginibacter sp.]|nr:hypothetical protein [Mucilaginibacter sp.]
MEFSETSKSSLPNEPYKGIKPFHYADREIFSVRDWEKEQLLNLILLYRGSLLYGQSGIGKSSLIQAGLVPLLEENNFNAEIIRIYPNKKETFCVYKIEKSSDGASYFPSLFDDFSKKTETRASISLSFNEFKQHLLSQTYENAKGSKKLTPVLIFDQFEELITLFEETGKIAVPQNDVPVDERKDFQTELIGFLRDCYYDQNLRVKFLFSFREDYLAKFSQLFRAIPDLRDHSLRIKAIDKEDIEPIIRRPFENKDSIDKYPNALTENEITTLNKALIEYFTEQDAVLTDVQIACQYVYETLPENRRKLFFNDDDDEVEDSIEKIIQLFYEKQLEKLPQKDKSLATDILSLLVLNEHTRNIFHFEAIIEDLENHYDPDDITRVLLSLDNDTRLIRSEIRSGGTYYEINSESLIPYINSLKIQRENDLREKELAEELKTQKSISDRLEAEKKAAVKQSGRFKKLLIAIISALLLIAIIIAIVQANNVIKGRGQVYLIAAKNAENPSLSYLIAKMGFEKTEHDEGLRKYIEGQKNRYSFITNILYYPNPIVTAFFKGNDTIGVVGASSVDYLNKKGLLVKQSFFNKIVYADAQKGYIINNVSNSVAALNNGILDTNQLCTFNGRVITKFTSTQNPNNFAIAPDGKTFMVDEFIYKIGVLAPYQRIILPAIGKDLMFVVFTKDSRHIVAGFWGGYVIVYDLNGKMVKAFQVGSNNPVVTSLAVSDKSKYIVVGGKENSLLFFEPDSLDLPGKDKISGKDIIKNAKATFLENRIVSGQINSVIISPDNKSFLATGEDKSATVWDFNGNKINVLKGHKEGVTSGAFSEDGKRILTWASTGKIYIWGKSNDDSNNKTAIFSPLDYRTSNLENYDISDAYPNLSTPDEMLSAGLNYLASLPQYNYYPEDRDYNEVLKTSLNEMSGIFTKLLRPLNTQRLLTSNKKLLYYSYAQFREDSLSLIE